jgi:hypothetical protein
MPIVLDGTNGITTPDIDSTGPFTGTTGTFSGDVTANGLTTELRPLVLMTAKTWNWNGLTTNTSIDFDTIPSWAKRVTVLFNTVSTGGSSGKIIQIGSATYDTSGYLGSESNIHAAVGSANVTNGFGIRSVSPGDIIHGTVTLSNVNGNTWVASGVLALSNTASTLLVSGSRALTGPMDRVRITTAGGTDTFDAGWINVMYE